MNKTPRTDGKTYAPDAGDFAFVDASFARRLESELAEARAEIERMSAKIGRLSRRMQSDASGYFEGSERLNSELEKARAEIERKDELIEQMRDALRWVLTDARLAHGENLVKAALKAAEGSE